MRAATLVTCTVITAALGCSTTADSGKQAGTTASTGTTGCDASADTDGDGLDDCSEADFGTDATLADSDGDGFSDGDELDCVSDPLDASEGCYACGWEHNDPGTLTATGDSLGDTVADLAFIDQCAEDVRLWDFAGSYTIAFITAAWCPLCKEEAAAVEGAAATLAASTGQDVHGLVVLFESRTAGAPSVDDVIPYADEIGATATPVLADTNATILSAMPYDGSELPGVCLLGPQMDILYCGAGQGQLPGLEAVINEHANP